MRRELWISLLILAGVWTFAVASHGRPAPELNWPEPYIAIDVQLSSVGEHLDINGVPAKILRYTTGRGPDEVVRYFSEHVDRDFRRAEATSALAGQTAVAGRMGDFWVVLQVKQQAGQTVGTWSATPQFVPGAREPVQRPAGFPASAKLLQQVDSFDAGKRSQLAMGVDPGPVDGVAAHIDEALRDSGFVKQSSPQTTWPSPSVYVALFRKPREDLMVTLAQEREGTSVLINRISALEELK